jgi:parallel beta-helix repeat protein
MVGSTIAQNAATGLALDASSASVRQSTISGNAGHGIGLWDASVLSLTLSTVKQNQVDGVHLESSIGSIRSNTITLNVGFGIYADASSLAAGYENTITGNGTDLSSDELLDLVEPR